MRKQASNDPSVHLSSPNFGIFQMVSAHLDKRDDAHHPRSQTRILPSLCCHNYLLSKRPHLSEQSPGDTGWYGAPSPPSLAASAAAGEQSGFPSGAGLPQHLHWVICSREGSARREVKLHKAAANLDLCAQETFLLAGCLRIKGVTGRSLANIASSTVG